MTTVPTWDEAVSFQTGWGSTWPPLYWVQVSPRTMRQSSVRRGRQYELDQVQPGEARATWANNDGAFTTTNTSSPFNGAVIPIRAYRERAQYPPTVNILTADQATAGEATPIAAGTVPASMQVSGAYGTVNLVADASAWQGGQVYQVSVTSGAAANAAILSVFGWSMRQTTAHSFQAQVRDITASTTVQVAAALSWVDVNGNIITTTSGSTVTLTGGTSAAWTQVTVTDTPPSNAAGGLVSVLLKASPSATVSVQIDGLQLEYNSAASTWAQPSTWYSTYTGWVERWPQLWEFNGTYSEITPTCIDSFGILSQIKLKPAFYADVLALAPNFFYPLDDPTNATQFVDASGNYAPAQLGTSPYGAGTLTSGNSVTAASPTTGTFTGGPGPVVTFANADSPVGTLAARASWVQLDAAGVQLPAVGNAWTRQVAFRCASVPANSGELWCALNPTYTAPVEQGAIVRIIGTSDSPGGLSLTPGVVYIGIGQNLLWNSPASVCDGNWHLLQFSLDLTGKNATICLDGTIYSVTSGTAANYAMVTTDLLGSVFYRGSNQVFNGFSGDVAHVAQWPTQLTNTQLQNLYTSWRTAWKGEATGTRYSRILSWAGFVGASGSPGPNGLISMSGQGATQSMGAATDVVGQDALSALQSVVVTENGNHYVSAGGTIVFEPRTARYNQLTPSWTFGDVTASEYGYEVLELDLDTTRIANIIELTQVGTNQLYRAVDLTSQNEFGPKTLSRTISTTSAGEMTDAATYFLNRYKQPVTRVKRFRIHPSASTTTMGLWQVCLSMALSSRLRIMRRPPGQPAIQFDGFLENVSWTRAHGAGDAYLDVEVSPANLTLYWISSALHTTLASTATAGASSITVNALPDAATNPFSSSVPSGLQLTLEPGTANSETLTVQSVSTTSPGYSTCTITFTSTLGFTHASSSVVCEKLTTGFTDPTRWDPAAIIGTSTTPAY